MSFLNYFFVCHDENNMMKFLLGNTQTETENIEDVDDDVMYYEVPEYMDIAPCEMFKEEIKNRRVYAQFVNNEFPDLENKLNNFIQKYSTQNSVGWIGGSRAWKRALSNKQASKQ